MSDAAAARRARRLARLRSDDVQRLEAIASVGSAAASDEPEPGSQAVAAGGATAPSQPVASPSGLLVSGASAHTCAAALPSAMDIALAQVSEPSFLLGSRGRADESSTTESAAHDSARATPVPGQVDGGGTGSGVGERSATQDGAGCSTGRDDSAAPAPKDAPKDGPAAEGTAADRGSQDRPLIRLPASLLPGGAPAAPERARVLDTLPCGRAAVPLLVALVGLLLGLVSSGCGRTDADGSGCVLAALPWVPAGALCAVLVALRLALVMDAGWGSLDGLGPVIGGVVVSGVMALSRAVPVAGHALIALLTSAAVLLDLAGVLAVSAVVAAAVGW